jgi:hypothetical protein
MAMSSITPVHTERVGSGRGLQGQQHRRRAGQGQLLLLPVLPPDQVIPGRQPPQLCQVVRVTQVLPSEHRRSLFQRQRQMPQFGGHG